MKMRNHTTRGKQTPTHNVAVNDHVVAALLQVLAVCLALGLRACESKSVSVSVRDAKENKKGGGGTRAPSSRARTETPRVPNSA